MTLGASVAAVILWLSRRQRVVVGRDAVVVQQKALRRVVPYDDIERVGLGDYRGVTLWLRSGSWVRLPWTPLRGPGAWGGGMARSNEIAEVVGRRAEAAGAGASAEGLPGPSSSG